MTFVVRIAFGLLLAVSQTFAQAGETLRIGGTGSALGTMQLLGEAFDDAQARLEQAIADERAAIERGEPTPPPEPPEPPKPSQ